MSPSSAAGRSGQGNPTDADDRVRALTHPLGLAPHRADGARSPDRCARLVPARLDLLPEPPGALRVDERTRLRVRMVRHLADPHVQVLDHRPSLCEPHVIAELLELGEQRSPLGDASAECILRRAGEGIKGELLQPDPDRIAARPDLIRLRSRLLEEPSRKVGPPRASISAIAKSGSIAKRAVELRAKRLAARSRRSEAVTKSSREKALSPVRASEPPARCSSSRSG